MQESGNNTHPLISILIPVLPLIIFFVVESFYGTKAGIVAALILGAIEFIVTYIKTKQIEKIIFLDIILLSAFGGVSLILENDFFILLKPAVLEAVFAIIIGVSIKNDKNILKLMMKRYLKKMNPVMEKELDSMSRHIVIMLMVHAVLIVVAAQFFSHGMWLFVSSTLLYIMVAVYAVLNVIKKRFFTEMLPLVDKEGTIVGHAPRAYCHAIEYPYHPVVHLIVTDKHGAFLLQKRSSKKDSYPLCWDSSVGGHVSYNEKLEDALKRETKEELGLRNFSFSYIGNLFLENKLGSEIAYLFTTEVSDVRVAKNKEVTEVAYFTLDEIKQLNAITPHVINECEIVSAFRAKQTI